ncbi:MAG: hypothetical protein ACK5ZV_13230 [bacterium]
MKRPWWKVISAVSLAAAVVAGAGAVGAVQAGWVNGEARCARGGLVDGVPGGHEMYGTAQAEQANATEFLAFAVIVHSDEGQRLAAWQVRLEGPEASTRASTGAPWALVGVEGAAGGPGAGAEGAAGAGVFSEPPRYDAAALAGDVVVLANYSVKPEAELPTGAVQVATVHVQRSRPTAQGEGVWGAATAGLWRATLVAAADAQGRAINGARVTVQAVGTPGGAR